jgi:Uma2 family endonuclease
MAAPALMTVDEYARTPETVLPQELRYGILHVADAPLVRHQQIVFAMAKALDAHVRERQLGRVMVSPLDVILDERRRVVVQPDLFFVSNDRKAIVQDRVRGAPDLVIEVLSPHPRIGDLNQHLAWFAEYGVRECWLFHQFTRRIDVLRFSDGVMQARESFGRRSPIRSAVLPGLMLAVESFCEESE